MTIKNSYEKHSFRIYISAEGVFLIMADYRRLISYIYEYEGKKKGKNVGFAKLEARNGQCRINVNVKRIYMGGNAIGAYLLGTGGRETFLGNVFVRGGNGEFRVNVDAKNVEGSGTGLDTYFGLSVHDVKNSWRCYKTIWEDALAAEEGNTGENPVLSVPKFTAQMLPEAEKGMDTQAVSKVVKEIEEEIAREEERREQEEKSVHDPGPGKKEESGAPEKRNMHTVESDEREKTAHAAELSGAEGDLKTEKAPAYDGKAEEEDTADHEVQQQEEQSEDRGRFYLSGEDDEIDEKSDDTCGNVEDRPIERKMEETSGDEEENDQTANLDPEKTSESETEKQQVETAQQEQGIPQETDLPFYMKTAQRVQRPNSQKFRQNPVQTSGMTAQSPKSAASQAAHSTAPTAPMVSPELENPEVLRYLQETEDPAADPEKLWEEFKRTYPKIQPFEYEDGCDILTIRPQDIGKLPRECWVYGNNSFLLHGYYNFRYLILVKLGGNKKKSRYLLGVPGHYYSSEKYMATMFGFPNFVLSRRQPVGDGRFGYWYTDLKIR